MPHLGGGGGGGGGFRLEKTCLLGFQPGKGLNQPALLHRLTRILKFCMQ